MLSSNGSAAESRHSKTPRQAAVHDLLVQPHLWIAAGTSRQISQAAWPNSCRAALHFARAWQGTFLTAAIADVNIMIRRLRLLWIPQENCANVTGFCGPKGFRDVGHFGSCAATPVTYGALPA